MSLWQRVCSQIVSRRDRLVSQSYNGRTLIVGLIVGGLIGGLIGWYAGTEWPWDMMKMQFGPTLKPDTMYTGSMTVAAIAVFGSTAVVAIRQSTKPITIIQKVDAFLMRRSLAPRSCQPPPPPVLSTISDNSPTRYHQVHIWNGRRAGHDGRQNDRRGAQAGGSGS